MQKRIKILSIPLILIVALTGFYNYSALSGNEGPKQPVLFSHKIHVGENGVPCEYCHSYVSISKNPGIPSLQKCMGCHSQVAGRDIDYKTQDGTIINIKNEIQKVRDYWQRKEPIPWVKVTAMPEYVHFNHKRHIKRGFECKACHGEVEKMDVVHQVERLNMGFCISCHEENADNEEHLTQLKDCLTCHY